MKHNDLLKARVINMLDDTRRYFLKVRSEIDNDDDIYLDVKGLINKLSEMTKLVDADDARMIPFDGVFYLRNEESDAFRIKYKAHRANMPR